MITGFFAREILPQPLIRAAVTVPDIRPEWISVAFVIDTGAAHTCIHAVDATRLFGLKQADLDPSRWADAAIIQGVGGSLAYRQLEAEYAFLRDDESWEVVAAPVRFGEFRSSSTPSLLGWDVLAQFDLEIAAQRNFIRLTRAQS